MLNTSIWPHDTSRSNTLYEPALIIDFDKEDELAPVPGHRMSETVPPLKPYIYGRSTPWARKQLRRVQENLHRYPTT